MSLFIGNTDKRWFEFLRARPEIDEVNFWQPGGSQEFRLLSEGDLFLFRLKSPINKIAGGGVFFHASRLPLGLAWNAFEERNGVASLDEFRAIISRYRSAPIRDDDQIGNIALLDPVFLPESEWISVPDDYSRNLVQGKRYVDTTRGPGLELTRWAQNVLFPIARRRVAEQPPPTMFGAPTLVTPRLGQGAFRVRITDLYARRCAVSGEKTLPVLQAAHIRPVSRGGLHTADNGLLLRSDIHTLFDLGYVGVTPEYRFTVSPHLKSSWQNGRIYYDLHDREIGLPIDPTQRPSEHSLTWHQKEIFRA